jgi:hypothetical protein
MAAVHRAPASGSAGTLLGADDRFLLCCVEGLPVRHSCLQREPVRQRDVQRLAAEVAVVFVVVLNRRVHRSPAVFQIRQRDALNAPLVDDGKEPVLHVQTSPRDLVDEDGLRAPHRCGCLHETQLAMRVGQRVAHQVVEVDERGVVVPPAQAEGIGQAFEQQRLGRPVRTDQQQRRLRGQRRQHYRLQRAEADEPEPGDQVTAARRRRSDGVNVGLRRLAGSLLRGEGFRHGDALQPSGTAGAAAPDGSGATDALAGFVNRPASCRVNRR